MKKHYLIFRFSFPSIFLGGLMLISCLLIVFNCLFSWNCKLLNDWTLLGSLVPVFIALIGKDYLDCKRLGDSLLNHPDVDIRIVFRALELIDFRLYCKVFDYYCSNVYLQGKTIKIYVENLAREAVHSSVDIESYLFNELLKKELLTNVSFRNAALNILYAYRVLEEGACWEDLLKEKI